MIPRLGQGCYRVSMDYLAVLEVKEVLKAKKQTSNQEKMGASGKQCGGSSEN